MLTRFLLYLFTVTQSMYFTLTLYCETGVHCCWSVRKDLDYQSKVLENGHRQFSGVLEDESNL